MDDKDSRLLELLQENARHPLDRLAEAVSLSVPAVQRRIKKMRDRGVISRDVSIVDAPAVGMHLTFIIIVELERDQGAHVEAFRRKAIAEPLVQQCYYVTGEGDFVLITVARNMAEYERMTRTLFLDDPNVQGFRTSIAMGSKYQSMALPVQASGSD